MADELSGEKIPGAATEFSDKTPAPSSETTAKKNDVRSALIAAMAAVLVGAITYFGTKASVAVQLNESAHSHARDLAGALHQSLGDLLDENEKHAARTRLAFSSIYFLGDSFEERKQIVKSAAAAKTNNVRESIAYVLSIDSEFGKPIANDKDVLRVLFPDRPLSWNPSYGIIVRETPRSKEELRYVIPRYVGTGWLLIAATKQRPVEGQKLDGVPSPPPSAVWRSHKPESNVMPARGDVLSFSGDRMLHTDSSERSQTIGSLKEKRYVVVLDVAFIHVGPQDWLSWANVFLCGADPIVEPSDAVAMSCKNTVNNKTN